MSFPIMWLRGNTNCPKVRLESFKIIRVLGKGRYGICYLAQNFNGEFVVIKRLRMINFEKTIENIQYEVTMLSTLECNKIPKVIGVINEKNFKGFVMEFIQGDTLSKLIKEDKYRFTKKEIYVVINQLIDIVRQVHEEEIVHRDIRTPNIIVSNGEVYLIDFGLARWRDYQYDYNIDFSFIGRVLITLLGTRLSEEKNKSELSWDKILEITREQKVFLKRMLSENNFYESIYVVQSEFRKAFYC